MLLIVVKGRQFQLFDFLPPLRATIILFLPKNSPSRGVAVICSFLTLSLSWKGQFPIDNLQKLGAVNHRISLGRTGKLKEERQLQLVKGLLYPEVRREEAALLVAE